MQRSAAEAVALQVVGWIAGPGDLLGVFLGTSGLAPDDLKAGLGDPHLLAAAMDFLFLDDQWVIEFMQHAEVAPEVLHAARAGLPGGDTPVWT
ncbi:DUF3572 domain-containing protein [Pseudoruegeria sp. SK021]|uniref:DUF3572 domain-containing protein n=1 Tax=Pseudoruegeria sp. SK021 TaxID=1933035 RepID=UPI000A2391B6|nr:DUF3572 domain-containing protein [Pseudoruegeria sp. SK021]OSP54306.1 hypothetical protein BV911_13105 [Pseudoruegeria sp. SK021]